MNKKLIDNPSYWRFYVVCISLPIAAVAFITACIGMYHFIIGIVAYLLILADNYFLITVEDKPPFLLMIFSLTSPICENKDQFFDHIFNLFGKGLFNYVKFACNSGLVFFSLMITFLGLAIGIINIINLRFIHNNFYYAASFFIMNFFYLHVLLYIL